MINRINNTHIVVKPEEAREGELGKLGNEVSKTAAWHCTMALLSIDNNAIVQCHAAVLETSFPSLPSSPSLASSGLTTICVLLILLITTSLYDESCDILVSYSGFGNTYF